MYLIIATLVLLYTILSVNYYQLRFKRAWDKSGIDDRFVIQYKKYPLDEVTDIFYKLTYLFIGALMLVNFLYIQFGYNIVIDLILSFWSLRFLNQQFFVIYNWKRLCICMDNHKK